MLRIAACAQRLKIEANSLLSWPLLGANAVMVGAKTEKSRYSCFV
jgi:hypothetical protein